jgi:DNA-directed RNA polymerase specialized sigma24 family protein
MDSTPPAGCEALRTADFPRDLLDVRPGDEAAVDEIELEDRLSLPDLLEGLGELERQAVVMRFFQNLKQNQIGTELG